jgi:hypothetical protein
MNLINIQYETELLESLDWSNERLKEFYEYLDTQFNNEILVSPNTLLQDIERLFGIMTKEVCKKIFSQVIVQNNLHHSGDTIEN